MRSLTRRVLSGEISSKTRNVEEETLCSLRDDKPEDSKPEKLAKSKRNHSTH